jgi:hypothetical protein
MIDVEDHEQQRPLGMTLLTGLYLFLFIVSLSTYGNPFPFMGMVHTGWIAQLLVFCDSLICLYLFLGIMKRQYLSWYLVIAYNLFEIVNTIINLNFIKLAELERVLGVSVSSEGLLTNNLMASLAMLLLTQYIYRSKPYFTNRQLYLF